ncbi:hypothetical protein [Streptomyces sp. x-80]|uniref:hypothetical protein n=1 Tax=Streptomyces sp. x-80 TaxID=2789282 RepID=UPI00397F18A7
MRPAIHLYAALAAALCVGGFLIGGSALVFALVPAGVAVLAWRVAAASRPRPRWRGRPGVPARGRAASGVRIRHQ